MTSGPRKPRRTDSVQISIPEPFLFRFREHGPCTRVAEQLHLASTMGTYRLMNCVQAPIHSTPHPFPCARPVRGLLWSAIPFCSMEGEQTGARETNGGRGVVRGAAAEADRGKQEEAGGAADPPPLCRRSSGRRQALAGGSGFIFSFSLFLSLPAAAFGVL